MTIFDVLDPSLELTNHFFIEASAGCGKTFSIENAYVRLILEAKEEIGVENILVLTFTKEATSELKSRIKRAIERAQEAIAQEQLSEVKYLRIWQHSLSEKNHALSRLKTALLSVDLMQILTIHKFCFLKLKEFLFHAQLNLAVDPEKEQIGLMTYAEIIKDYLSFEYEAQDISLQQFHCLFKAYSSDFNQLIKACAIQLAKESSIEKQPSFNDLCRKIFTLIEKIQQSHNCAQKDIELLLLERSSYYKGALNRQKDIHQELKAAIESFAALFDSSANNNTVETFLPHFSQLRKVFLFENLKKGAVDHPILTQFERELWPHFEQAISKEYLLALLTQSCFQRLQNYFQRHHILTPNNILSKFNELIQDQSIAKAVSAPYRAVIIDEFQDTDPLQWKILSQLFLNQQRKPQSLLLVGDPKQSIYGFRKADVYIYLKAAQMLNIETPYILNTNYRSSPPLIEALNDLFEKPNSHWIELPKLKKSLQYQRVQSHPEIQPLDFLDEKKPLHFFVAESDQKMTQIQFQHLEQDYFFPFIAKEVSQLVQNTKIKFSQCAVLVKDRFQAARLKVFFKSLHLPFTSTRADSLQGKKTVADFLDIFRAVLAHNKVSDLYILKLNSLIHWPLKSFSPENIPLMIQYFAELKSIFVQRGFLSFFNHLMQNRAHGLESIYEHLLATHDGIYLYQELEQIKELILELEVKGVEPYSMLQFLEELSKENTIVDTSFPVRQNFEEEGIQILTLHMSKGLEFEVVFALGLASQNNFKEEFITKEDDIIYPKSSLSEDELKEATLEQNAEKLRTLYVAMTRAKQRLYVPYVAQKEGLENSSIIDLFFKKLGFSLNTLIDFASNHPNISVDILGKVNALSYSHTSDVILIHPTKPNLNYTKCFKYSFSSLSQKHERNENMQAPMNFHCEKKTIHTLPAGPQTGTLFHAILEQITFDQPLDLLPWVEHTPYASWQEVLSSWVEQVLNTAIEGVDFSFTLKDIPVHKIHKEIEFLLPIDSAYTLSDNLTLNNGFLNGVIDLIVEYDNKFYIIDYKTNWLGEKDEDYHDIHTAMQTHDYLLQAEIYFKALERYLMSLNVANPKEKMGKVIYWFTRGINHFKKGIYTCDF